MHKHMKTRSIYKVDLHATPLGKGHGIQHGGATGGFFFVISSYGFRRGRHICGMQQSGDERGLSAVRMPHYSYVADLTSRIGLHKQTPCIERLRAMYRKSA